MDIFLTSQMAPFSAALAIFAGLLILELSLGFVGGSLLGGDSDVAVEADVDVDADFDLSADGDMAFDTEVDTDLDTDATAASSWMGLGDVPLMIWIATALVSFGLSGFVLQTLANSLLGSPLPAWLAAIPAAQLTLQTTRSFSRRLARLVPKAETQSVSERHLGRRRGVVTVGTARRGTPAEVRVTDRYGNTHYLRAEPFSDDAVIPAGTDVVVMRATAEGTYYLVALET